jgi:hypothetical protein
MIMTVRTENVTERATAVRKNVTAIRIVSAALCALMQMEAVKECVRGSHAKRLSAQKPTWAEAVRTLQRLALQESV